MKTQPAHKGYSDEEIIRIAQERYGQDESIEIDPDAKTARPDEGDLAYVQAWICVDLEPRTTELPEALQNEIYRRWQEQVRPKLDQIGLGTPGPVIQFLDWLEEEFKKLENDE